MKIRGTLDIPHFGAFVDVFPLDKVPEDEEKRLGFYKELEDAYNNVITSLPFQSYNTLPLSGELVFGKSILIKRKCFQKRTINGV